MIFDIFPAILSVATYLSGLPAHLEYLNYKSSDTTASSGCGSAPTWQFDANNHVNVTTGDRSFRVHIPVSYDASTPHAMVLSFHGFKRNDVNQEKISGFSDKGIKLNGKVRVDRSLSALVIDRTSRALLQVKRQRFIVYPLSLLIGDLSLS
jgi:hypothetical protein